MDKRIKLLEKKVAKLEKAVVLFEKHRQSWITLNKDLAKLQKETERDERRRLKREKHNSDQFAKIIQSEKLRFAPPRPRSGS